MRYDLLSSSVIIIEQGLLGKFIELAVHLDLPLSPFCFLVSQDVSAMVSVFLEIESEDKWTFVMLSLEQLSYGQY